MKTKDTGASGCPCAAAMPFGTSEVLPASSPTAEEGLGTRDGHTIREGQDTLTEATPT